jgi:hypothetical protein
MLEGESAKLPRRPDTATRERASVAALVSTTLGFDVKGSCANPRVARVVVSCNYGRAEP